MLPSSFAAPQSTPKQFRPAWFEWHPAQCLLSISSARFRQTIHRRSVSHLLWQAPVLWQEVSSWREVWWRWVAPVRRMARPQELLFERSQHWQRSPLTRPSRRSAMSSSVVPLNPPRHGRPGASGAEIARSVYNECDHCAATKSANAGNTRGCRRAQVIRRFAICPIKRACWRATPHTSFNLRRCCRRS